VKSGRKIYGRLLRKRSAASSYEKRLRKLDAGELRSLILYTTRGPLADGEPCATIASMAVAELTLRFLDKGREVL
jgi:hypothetical protein